MPQPKTALTQELVAALALGAPAAMTPAAEATTVTTPAADATGEVSTTPAVDTPIASAEAATTPAVANGVEAFLKGELSVAQARVAELTVELAGLKASADAGAATATELRAIAQSSLKYLRVAMNQEPAGVEALNDSALLAEHKALRARFETKYTPGGVAAVATPEASENAGAGSEAADAMRQARLAATRVSTAK